jgi:hypothetical protein
MTDTRGRMHHRQGIRSRKQPVNHGSEKLEAEGLAQQAKGKAEGDGKQAVKDTTKKVADGERGLVTPFGACGPAVR